MNGVRGARSRYLVQHAKRTFWSNGALWAARNSASSIHARRVGQRSAKVGASRTSSQRKPWILVNEKRGVGGRIGYVRDATIRPSEPAARPTAHALSRRDMAVSKSIATKVLIDYAQRRSPNRTEA